MFLFGKTYFIDTISQVGGGALYLAEFIVQFFAYPYAGASITALLITLVAFLMHQILIRIDVKHSLYALSILPAIALLMLHFDFNYTIQGTVAFIGMEAFLLGCLLIKKHSLQRSVSIIILPLFYWLCGPVSILFAITFFIITAIIKQPFYYLNLFILAEAIFLSILSVTFSKIGSYRLAFLPDAYYQQNIIPGNELYYPWIAIFLVVTATFILSKNKAWEGKKRWMSTLFQTICLGALFYQGITLYDDSKSYKMKTLDYYVRTEQWDKIIEQSKGKISNFLYMNYLNLALAEKGLLADYAFSFDQQGIYALLVKNNKTAHVYSLLNEIYFSMGAVYLSQRMAFESNMSETGIGNPRLWKRLVQTNLIIGAYPVAEKYIVMLEKTLYYADWATSHRPFLFNDAAVEADPLLGEKRRCLPRTNHLSLSNGLDQDLMAIIEANPSSTRSIEYLGCQYLFNKDIQGFKQMMAAYNKIKVYPKLPRSFEEALLAANEKNIDQLGEYNISPESYARFNAYRQYLFANKGASNIKQLMYQSYGNTYWYHFMFK